MESLKGQLLIASPELTGPFFGRTVILMLEHGEEGALGVVLNKPTAATVSAIAGQIFSEPYEWDKPIHLGGPVSGPLTVLHAHEELADREVIPGVYTSVEAEKVREVLRRRSEPCLVVADYSGWGPGQLEREMSEGSWLTRPADPAHIFWEGEGDLWDEVVAGPDDGGLARFLNIPHVPEDPSLN